MIKKLVTNFCACFSVIFICYLISISSIVFYFDSHNKYHTEDKKFIIENGLTFRQVVEKLHRKRIIKHPDSFLYISQLIKGLDPKVHYGEYFFEKDTSYYQILHKMISGYTYFRKITIAEGLSTKSALAIINENDNLIGKLPNKIIEEGSLLPETYFYSSNDSKVSMIERMQASMTKAIDELWAARDLRIPVRTKKDAIILASIVEKETGAAEERPQVASVFTNRLRRYMKLQSDPTVIYSYAFGDKSLERPIRMSDLQNNSPYNTYHIYGLPKEPICNPGIAAIKAVLNPPKTDYLYFVATGKGSHHFSKNLKEHNRYVVKYRKFMKEKAEAQSSKEIQ